ncbi:7-deoxyloganetin glucosyltransferase-like [Chenopodium quinoa]|uniref:7-deoxyloganetin glucosyltransferase-like n=1 Tax=Chenopodium quinoa TaxID=63459 RepID=UPI000B795A6E|nr:7-deoxyloganetin glucosyltransferase-like [Chenopodium quinoa]
MATNKPHVICVPIPYQGHINPMFKLAKLLHSRGVYITMVVTEFNVARLASSSTVESPFLEGFNDFSIEVIPDGLPPDNKRSVFNLHELCYSFRGIQGEPQMAIRSLLMRLLESPDIPPVTSVISDAMMTFVPQVCIELGIPVFHLYTTSACGMLGYMQFDELVKRGDFPLKDESCLTNGYLDTSIEWVPGLIKEARMKHLPTFLRTTDPNEIIFNYLAEATRNAKVTAGLILNTFDDLEGQILKEIEKVIANIYTIGPLTKLSQPVNERKLLPLSWSLWKEDNSYLEWLDKRSPKSVIYVNFGSIAVLTPEQLKEFAWGLANSKHPFLWVIRSDLVIGESNIITEDCYMEEIKDRGLILSWCLQEKVLQHPSVAVFLTHCGWNSTLESIGEGVPMICWPFFAEQQMNGLYACKEWRVGVEMEEGSVQRKEVEGLVRDVMESEKGKELKGKAMEWKKKAEEATRPGGSSYNNFDKLVRNLVGKGNHC